MSNHVASDHSAPLKVAIILGSTRPGRRGEPVAKWVLEHAQKRTDAKFELLDLQDYPLPHLDEPIPPSAGKYAGEHTKKWAAKIGSFDAFVFVTPEYNHGTSGVLKNAIDFVYQEWNNKSAGFVGYGAMGGILAVESLRLVMGELQVADVRAQVPISLFTDFVDFQEFKPAAMKEALLTTMLDQVIAWGRALRALRVP
ncbi:MAG: NAD(P)H-dependent oxidoreductase [Thermoplasmata archaeon]|nr:NAD(P)H-dependent oxidoreductase [Thermoplasmata archaeon]